MIVNISLRVLALTLIYNHPVISTVRATSRRGRGRGSSSGGVLLHLQVSSSPGRSEGLGSHPKVSRAVTGLKASDEASGGSGKLGLDSLKYNR